MVCQHRFSCLVQRKKKKVKINVTFLKQSSKRIFIVVMELTRLYMIVISLKFIEPFLFSDWLGLRLVCILLLFYIAIIEITQEITRDIKWRRRRRRFYKYL